MLQKTKDPFPKSIAEACRVLAGWKNLYGILENCLEDANDRVEFMTSRAEEKKAHKKKENYMFYLQENRTIFQSVRRGRNCEDINQESF